jgi:hypothetical protein
MLYEGMDWIYLAHDIHSNELSGFILVGVLFDNLSIMGLI